MPAAKAIPGLKKRTTDDGLQIWHWVASQISRLSDGFHPRTVRLWRGAGQPSAKEIAQIQRHAQQLTIDLQEWVYDPNRRTRSKRGLIYFIRVGDKVKVGFTNDIDRRVSELKLASPFDLELVLLIAGSAVTERAMHRRFKAQRVGREWFRYDGPIKAFVMRTSQNQLSEPLSEPLFKRREESNG